MNRVQINRRRAAAAAFLILTATMLVAPAKPASAAESMTTLIVAPKAIKHNGATYHVSLGATFLDWATDQEQLRVTLARVYNPDGTGPLKATNRKTYSFQGLSGVFKPSASPPTLRTGSPSQTAPYVSASLSFVQESTKTDCGGTRTYRRGRLAGTLRLDSRTGFGAVAVTGFPSATLTTSGDTACPTPAAACGAPYLAVSGSLLQNGQHFTVDAYRTAGASTMSISAAHTALSPSPAPTRAGVTLQVQSQVIATVPASNLTVNNRLDAGSLKSPATLPLRGTANWRPVSELQEGQWHQCGDPSHNMEASISQRFGHLTGNMKIIPFIGAQRQMPAGEPLSGIAMRFQTRRTGLG